MRTAFFVISYLAWPGHILSLPVANHAVKHLKIGGILARFLQATHHADHQSKPSEALVLLLQGLRPTIAFNTAVSQAPLQRPVSRAEPRMQARSDALTIVVTGASGRAGGALVQQLLREGIDFGDKLQEGSVQVIALVRNATKARSLYGDGIQILEADYADSEVLNKALGSVELGRWRMFLACGNSPTQLRAELNLLAAAEDHGCEYVVKLSTLRTVLEAATGGPYQAHQEAEDALLSSTKLKYKTVLRPNLFMQMLHVGPIGFGHLIKSADTCEHMFSNTPISMIDVLDVAAVAGKLLTSADPSIYNGQKLDLTGPTAVSVREIADVISNLRPRPVVCKACSVEDHVGRLGLPPQLASSFQNFFEIIGKSDFISDSVHRILGRPARSAVDFVYASPNNFLPTTYASLVGKSKDVSFRAGTTVAETDLEKQLSEMKSNDLFLKVLVAGVNGGADSFRIINAGEGETDFPVGMEGAGRVVAVGNDVTKFAVGDLVSFVGGFSYAEYTSVDALRCQRISLTAPLAEFLALRVSALTASVGLQRTAGMQQSDVVLVTAACGATGSFAVQLAKLAGATVIGTVGSAAKVEVAKNLGCDRVVNYREENLGDVLKREFPDGIDIAYDGVGGSLFRAAYDNLAEGGRILIVGAISAYPHNESPAKHEIEGLEDLVELFRTKKTVELPGARKIIGDVWGDGYFGTARMFEDRERIFELHAAGKLRALIESNKFLGVNSIPDAVDYMLSGANIGKVWVQCCE